MFGSRAKFKAVNSKDRNDTRASMKRRIARVEQHIDHYLSLLDEADKEEPSVRDMKVPYVIYPLVKARRTTTDR